MLCHPPPGHTGHSTTTHSQEKKSALIRQLTFVETSCQTQVSTEDVNKSVSVNVGSNTSRKVIEGESQTVSVQCKEATIQTDTRNDVAVSVLGTQTIPVAVSQVSVQTDPTPVVEDVISQQIPTVTRTPRYELTFSGSQTSPTCVATCEVQTSPQISSRTRDSSPVTLGTRVPVIMTDDAADEMVCRVLLEHAGASDSDRDVKSAISSSSSTLPDSRSASILSEVSQEIRAASCDTKNKMINDLSRTVNYLDLSRLGNEGETPNSDEIWVTVEDDNKFLTSDTETYSVATDKVSTMATFKGHAVGSGFAENIALFNSASETELAELGNESLVGSDLEGQDFTLQNFGTLLHSEMEPIRTRLDSTGRTVSGIAETLYHIQVFFVRKL